MPENFLEDNHNTDAPVLEDFLTTIVDAITLHHLLIILAERGRRG